jgi:hypothetical protein
MPNLPLFENIANRCGVKTCHWPFMDVNGLEQFGGWGKKQKKYVWHNAGTLMYDKKK